MKKLFYTSIIFVCLTFYTNAQVGINLTNPSKHAALEINGQGTKGIVIPKMNYEMRYALLEYNTNRPPEESLPQGLLVFDPDLNMFFFLNENEKEEKNEWIALNPLQASDENRGTLKTSNNGSTANFANNVVVTGSTTLQKDVTINSALLVKGNIDAGSNSINSGSISTNVCITSTVNATTGNINTVNATTVNATNGNGITPIGGIIMWSGSINSIPNGWSLCDGRTESGIKTPDLRGRFIISSGRNTYIDSRETENPTYQIGDRGGINKYALDIKEMPKHNHYVRRDKHGNNNNSGIGNDSSVGNYDATAYESMGNYYTSYEGNSLSHENRPPYYALAFIMRTK